MNKDLLDKYLNNKCTDAERELVESWYENYTMTNSTIYEGDAEAIDKSAIHSLGIIKSKIEGISNEQLAEEQTTEVGEPVRSINWYKRWSWAVAAAVILVVGVVWTKYNQETKVNNIVHNDVLPGDNKAILQLSDGRNIDLNAEQSDVLLREAGLEIKKTTDGQIMYVATEGTRDNRSLETVKRYNTISTPRSGRYAVILPDGSKVTLNAASSIRYPVPFDATEREVHLQGEAFFEVVQLAGHTSGSVNAKVPFIVHAGNQRVEVLGTSFNINAYKDEKSSMTSLITGKVNVSLLSNPMRQFVLTPGQSAISDAEGMRQEEAHIESVIAWKNNYFYFNDQHISTILRQIERWYDVDFLLDKDLDITELYFSGSVSNDKNLSQVLRLMERTGMVKFKIEGRRVTVMD